MVQELKSWRGFIWFTAALAGFNILVLWLLYPESTFRRPTVQNVARETASDGKTESSCIKDNKPESRGVEHSVGMEALYGVETVNISNPSWSTIWTSFLKTDQEQSFVKVLLHPLIFITYPSVLWAIFIYGMALSPQVMLM